MTNTLMNTVNQITESKKTMMNTIMLFITVYYFLVAIEELNEYKDSLCYDKNKKQFYFLDKIKKKGLKIMKNIIKIILI